MVGVQAYTFHKFTFEQTLDKLNELGINQIEVYFGQDLGDSFGHKTLTYQMDAQTQEKVLAAARAKGITIAACGVAVCENIADWETLFAFAQNMGIKLITCEPQAAHLDAVERLCDKYEIDVGIHNHPRPSNYWHPDSVLKALSGRSARMGVCADVGHWKREGIDHIDAIRKTAGILKSLHFKDIIALPENGDEQHDCIWGQGILNVPLMLNLLNEHSFTGLLSIEYEYNWEHSVPDIQECLTVLYKEIPSITDLVLIYGGGKHRNMTWDKAHFGPYVTYTNTNRVEQWLFDGFLFLEFTDGLPQSQHIFATGYYGQPAGKVEWTALVDYYFAPDNAVVALEQTIADAERRIGKPTEKRKIIICIPEPIIAGPNSYYKTLPADYWGDIDGKKLDFTQNHDRLTACRWYIDYVCTRFEAGKFKHLELAGFYWVAEESLHTKDILAGVAEYLNNKNYSFNWIPYWKTEPDYLDWKSLKFNYAYLQPNYFFSEATPYSRLTDACTVALDYELDLELEFDLRAFAENKNWAYRLRDYMNVFRSSPVFATKRIAYYQDTDAIYQFYKATNPRDKELFHEFCTFVTDHQKAAIHLSKP